MDSTGMRLNSNIMDRRRESLFKEGGGIIRKGSCLFEDVAYSRGWGGGLNASFIRTSKFVLRLNVHKFVMISTTNYS